ncbi:MAG: phosphotransferase [Nitrospinota bacterium]
MQKSKVHQTIVSFADTLSDAKVARIYPIEKEASTKNYYRVEYLTSESILIMEAEDILSAEQFIDAGRLLTKYEVKLPTIIDRDKDLIGLEDLGSVSLHSLISSFDDDQKAIRYQDIIDKLSSFQVKTAVDLGSNLPSYKRFFDLEKLNFETDFAIKHFMEGYLKLKLVDIGKIKAEWTLVNDILAQTMETLCHRDFHARNLMVKNETIYWIDYQDLRVGRCSYDLASLLEDPYSNLSKSLKERLYSYYIDSPNFQFRGQPAKFEFIYNLTALQRLFKALGTYGYQVSILNNSKYERYIAIALSTFKNIAIKENRFQVLLDILDEKVL